MPVTVTHSTPADGTFSTAGAIAWDANHTLSGLGTGVETALGIAVGSAGGVVVNGGALGTPASGLLTNCTGLPVSTGLTGLGTGVAAWMATPTSANLASAITDETGSGSLVFANTPTLVTPILGTPTSGTLTNCTGLPVGGISATGTPGATTYLRGDGTWSTIAATAPGGSTTQLQYNNAGAFAGASGITTDGTDLTLGSSSRLLWSTDLILRRSGAGNIAHGGADAASPVAQTISVQNVVAGTLDTAGANLTIAGSRSTGTGAAGNILFQTASSGSTGTAQNALATVMTIGPNTLTGSQATSLIDLAQTWNTSGTPIAFKLNVTNTASNANSLLMDLQVAGASKASIRPSGDGSFVGLYIGGTSFAYSTAYIGSLTFILRNSTTFTWNSDLILRRKAAANLQFGDADAAAPVAQTLSVQSVVAGTSNTAGANFTITGSQGTGTGAGGSIIFQTAPAGTSGTSQNVLSAAWGIDANLTLYPAASQSTSMTRGFVNIPGAAGAPSGAPANTTGFPMYYDSTNNKIYVYNGSWRSTAALT